MTRSSFGPGIVIRAENFGIDPREEPPPDDAFVRRQDAIQFLNDALSEADEAAAKTLEARRAAFLAGQGEPVFADAPRTLLAERHKQALEMAPDSTSRDELADAFDRLTERHLRRATVLEQDARVRARAMGAERALARLTSAAIADPDGLPDRVAEANAVLARMVEAGTDPAAAAGRAEMFRQEIGRAALDDLAERDPADAVARLENGMFDDLFDDEVRAYARAQLARIADADSEARHARTSQAQRSAELERAAKRRATIQALTLGLRDRTMDQSHIARALYRGDLDESDADALRIRLANFTEQRLHRAEVIDRFDAVAKSDAIVIESETWDPEVVDAWAQRERNQGTPISEIIMETFRLSGGIPQTAMDEMRTLILSASTEDSILAGREFRTLQRMLPGAAETVLGGLPNREANTLSSLAEYAHLDLPPEHVVQLANEAKEGNTNSSQNGKPPVLPPPIEVPEPSVPEQQRNPPTDENFQPPPRWERPPPYDPPRPLKPWGPDLPWLKPGPHSTEV